MSVYIYMPHECRIIGLLGPKGRTRPQNFGPGARHTVQLYVSALRTRNQPSNSIVKTVGVQIPTKHLLYLYLDPLRQNTLYVFKNPSEIYCNKEQKSS